jgi:fumarylacetoacetase
MPLNETHDQSLRSWVESANDPNTDFPIQNLPFCVFEEVDADGDELACVGAVIGDHVLNLHLLAEQGLFRSIDPDDTLSWVALTADNIARVFAHPSAPKIRAVLSSLLRHDATALRDDPDVRSAALRPLADARLVVPVRPPNYTDFYASIHHAQTVGSMFRPDNPLLPNYKHVPIGYHGRASSIVISGTDIHRPKGQLPPPDSAPQEGPTFGPCKLLDYELEVGCFVGPGNQLGHPISIAEAESHIFGLCLVNDWSARDMQKWEYQPLGPFLAKNFATTISPYIVTLEAIEPFRVPAYQRPDGDPRPLPYLFSEKNQSAGGFDITLEVYLQSAEMQRRGHSPILLSRSNAFKEMYWTLAQLLTHHASNGCNLQPGDLLASGTVSGRGPTERGCLLELTWDGTGPDGKPKPRKPIQLPTGETRTFLADGDEITMKGYCQREGFHRIGFGECRGRILSAHS